MLGFNRFQLYPTAVFRLSCSGGCFSQFSVIRPVRAGGGAPIAAPAGPMRDTKPRTTCLHWRSCPEQGLAQTECQTCAQGPLPPSQAISTAHPSGVTPNTYNSKRAVSGLFKPAVTFTGMTGHVAGIIGHDHLNTQKLAGRAKLPPFAGWPSTSRAIQFRLAPCHADVAGHEFG